MPLLAREHLLNISDEIAFLLDQWFAPFPSEGNGLVTGTGPRLGGSGAPNPWFRPDYRPPVDGPAGFLEGGIDKLVVGDGEKSVEMCIICCLFESDWSKVEEERTKILIRVLVSLKARA